MTLPERFARGLKATLLSKVVYSVSNAALMILLTRYLLEPSTFGLLHLSLSVLGIAGIVSSLGLPKSTARYIAEYAEKDPLQVRHILKRTALFLGVLAAVVSVGMWAVSDDIAALLGNAALAPFFVVGVGYVVLRSFNSYLMLVFQGFNRVDWSGVLDALSSVMRVVFAVAFVLLGFGALGALLGYVVGFAIATIVGAVVLYTRFYRNYQPTASPETGLSKRILRYSLPLTVTQAAGVIDKKIDTVLVGVILNTTAVGYYVVARQVTDLVAIPATSFGFTLSPSFGQFKASGELTRAARIYEESLKYILLFYIPAAVGLVLVAEPLIRYVFGAEYVGAAPVLQVLSVFIVMTAVNKTTSDALDFLGLANERAVAKVLMAFSNVGLNVLLIPTMGVVGAAVATAITFSAYTLVNVFYIHRELSLRFGRLVRVVAINGALTGGMALVVVVLLPYTSGLVSLLLVAGAGAVIWAVLAVLSGLLNPRQVAGVLG